MASHRPGRLFVVTVTVAYSAPGPGESPAGPHARIADALMEIPDVVGVRVEDDDGSAVYRVDVRAATESAAAAQAVAPAAKAAAVAGLRAQVTAVSAVTDAERIERFRARMREGREQEGTD